MHEKIGAVKGRVGENYAKWHSGRQNGSKQWIKTKALVQVRGRDAMCVGIW
jgi:hypothetical protein